jgi:hypothetical protein
MEVRIWKNEVNKSPKSSDSFFFWQFCVWLYYQKFETQFWWLIDFTLIFELHFFLFRHHSSTRIW